MLFIQGNLNETPRTAMTYSLTYLKLDHMDNVYA